MTPAAWQPRPLQSAGTGPSLFARLTGRNQTMPGTPAAPQPQPLAPVVPELTGEDAPVTMADVVAYVDGRLDDHANQLHHPDNPLSGDEWDGT